MMYLVLTALLALNVSAEILQAFESLRNSLDTSVKNFAETNGDNVVLMRDHIKGELEKGNHRNEYMVPMLDQITGETAAMLAELDKMVGELEVIGEKDEATGEIVMKAERDANYRYWMGKDDMAAGGRGDGAASVLHDKLNGYIAWANQFYLTCDTAYEGEKFHKIALEPREDPSVTSAESKDKTWEYMTFHNKPLIADLAMLEKFKMDIRQVESELLSHLKERLMPKFTIDSLVAIQAPISDVVAAGTYFEADLFVAMSSKDVKPEFMGSGITVNPDGSSARIKIPASASSLGSRTEGTQSWSASIKVPMADGTFKVLPVSGQFTVRKPEVVIRSATVQSLYKDCGNAIEVDVPALGDAYNPDFSGSTGGAIKKVSGSKKKITIVPTARKFNLKVSSNTNGQNINIDNITYDVLKPPPPRIAVYMSNGREYSSTVAMSKRDKVKLKIIPDQQFQDRLSKDARYDVKSVKLMLKDDMGPPKVIKTYRPSMSDVMNGFEIKLYQGKIKQAQFRDLFYIEVEGVQRVNFEGKKISESLPAAQLMIGGPLK